MISPRSVTVSILRPTEERSMGLVFTLFGLFVTVFLAGLLNGCAMNESDTLKFLLTCGVKDIPRTNIVQIASLTAINGDYRNRVYFVILRTEQEEFNQFVVNNDFQKDEVLAVPTKTSTWPKVPKWWDAPAAQNERYSKTCGHSSVVVIWNQGKTYIFGSD